MVPTLPSLLALSITSLGPSIPRSLKTNESNDCDEGDAKDQLQGYVWQQGMGLGEWNLVE